MTADLAARAGRAVAWKGFQLVANRLISLVRLLVLARLLVPEDFGLLAIGLTAVQTVLTITDFGMIPALVQYPDLSERHYHAAWTVGLGRATLISSGIALSAPWIALLYKEPAAESIIQVLAIKPVLEALCSIKLADLTRRLRFRSLAAVGLIQVVVDSIISIALASQLGVWALVVGLLSGTTAGLFFSYLLAPYRPRLLFDRAAAAPLIRYGRWVFLTGIIAVSGSLVLQIVIARQLGAASLGLYYLAVKLAFLLSDLAAEVIAAVAFPVYARLQNQLEQSARAFRAILVGTATLLVPAYGLLIALAPLLEQVVLGDKWTGTAAVVRVLSLVGLLGLFGETVVPVLKGFGQPYKVAVLELIQSSLIIAFAWILADSFGLVGAALAWMPAIAVSQLVSIGLLRRILERPFAQAGRPLLVVVLMTGLGVLLALTLAALMPGLPGLVTASVGAGVVIWGGLLLLDRQYELGLLADLILAFPQFSRLAGPKVAGR